MMQQAQATHADLPTKRPRDENFPVASLILSRPRRTAILAFYKWVRFADDIADSSKLDPTEKIRQLDELEQALVSASLAEPRSQNLREADRRHGTGVGEARDMLVAFRQDAEKNRYANWCELMDYCRSSANPVGRFLLRLHGEREQCFPAADALCTALQILNHLQDCARDRAEIDRVYLPQTWLDLAGGDDAFFLPANHEKRRPIIDAVLDRVDHLIDIARALPGRLQSRRLRAQSIATIALAQRLSGRLRVTDPVLERVSASKFDASMAFCVGLWGVTLARQQRDDVLTAAAVQRSGSSFRLGMKSLNHERRRAIHAVYAFCRAVDDISDGAAPQADKHRFIDEWRVEIDNLHRCPATPIGRELARASDLFDLPLDECRALLDGMATDSADCLRMPFEQDLSLYARRVAGSVGLMSIRIFGAARAQDFALGLGHTLQMVNILRDVDEDAERERVYVPLSRLAEWGISDGPAKAIVADPRFARACEAMAQEARQGFEVADRALAELDRKTLKPAILMMESYRRILDRLIARGWNERGGKLRLTTGDRMQLLSLALRTA